MSGLLWKSLGTKHNRGSGDVPWYYKLEANVPGVGKPHRPLYLGYFQTKQTAFTQTP